MKKRKKRAVLAGLAAVCLIGMTGSLAAGCGKKDAVSEKTGQEPVSYTHLDVYKRQETEKCARQIRDCEAFLHVEPTLGALLKAGGAYEE